MRYSHLVPLFEVSPSRRQFPFGCDVPCDRLPVSGRMRFDHLSKLDLFQHACELYGGALVRVEQIGFDARFRQQ